MVCAATPLAPSSWNPRADFAELKKKLDERKSLVEAFNVYDKDGDGEVSLGDLYQTMLSNGESVTLDEVKEMLNECDLHHNGEAGTTGCKNPALPLAHRTTCFSFHTPLPASRRLHQLR